VMQAPQLPSRDESDACISSAKRIPERMADTLSEAKQKASDAAS
jgi:hypothetical protein